MSLGQAIDRLPIGAKRRIVEAERFTSWTWKDEDGAQCLTAHACAARFTYVEGTMMMPLRGGGMGAPGMNRTLNMNPQDTAAANALRMSGHRSDTSAAQWDALVERVGLERAVELVKERARKGLPA